MRRICGWFAAGALGWIAVAGASEYPSEENILLVAGSSSTDRSLLAVLLDPQEGICESNAPDGDADPSNDLTATVFFSRAADMSSPENFLVFCRSRQDVALLHGVRIGVGKFSGGSQVGLVSVAQRDPLAFPGAPVAYPNPQISQTCQPAVAGPGSGTAYIHYQVISYCGLAVPGQDGAFPSNGPAYAISDVEPEAFGLTETGLRSDVHSVDVVYGIALSRNFYSALQAAQGLTGTRTAYRGPGEDWVAGTADDSTVQVTCDDLALTYEDCLPSLTKAQVRGLLAQKISNVTDFRANGSPLAAPAGGVGIRICRRGDTSGTQKAFASYFFGEGCNKAPALVFARDTNVVDADFEPAMNCAQVGCYFKPANVGPTGIFQGKSSNDVEACLEDARLKGIYAVGILSTDRIPDNSTHGYRYIKIDGVAPLLRNVMDGRYDFFNENVMYARTDIATARNAIATAIYSRLTVPTDLRGLLTFNGIRKSANDRLPNTGVLVRPTVLFPPEGPTESFPVLNYLTRPVNPLVKGISLPALLNIDNCIKPAFIRGTDSPVSPQSLTFP